MEVLTYTREIHAENIRAVAEVRVDMNGEYVELLSLYLRVPDGDIAELERLFERYTSLDATVLFNQQSILPIIEFGAYLKGCDPDTRIYSFITQSFRAPLCVMQHMFVKILADKNTEGFVDLPVAQIEQHRKQLTLNVYIHDTNGRHLWVGYDSIQSNYLN